MKKIEIAKKMSHKDEMSHKYGGMTESGEYIKPDTHSFAKNFKKEQRMFDSGKREINRLKRQGK